MFWIEGEGTQIIDLKRRRRNLGLPDPELIVFWLVEKFGADNLKELPAKKSELKNPGSPCSMIIREELMKFLEQKVS